MGDAPYVFRAGPLSNFAACSLELVGPDGQRRTYPSVEHYFQAWKSLDIETHDWIASAGTPREAKQRGRSVRLRADWESAKCDVMLVALKSKFAVPRFTRALLATGMRPLIEESRYDREWGARRTRTGWDGQNLLGQLLSVLRDELRAAAHADEQLKLTI